MKFKYCSHIDTNNYEYQISSLYQSLLATIENSSYGFFDLPSRSDLIESCHSIYDKFSSRKNFVHIGIGGSALGPRMLIEALGKSDQNFYFLDNTDSEDTFEKINSLDISDTLFYVVSKSGGTAETIANFIICYNFLLSKGVQKDKLNEYFVFCTDPKKSELKDLAQELQIECLEIPTNIGGRFSVLSPAGLLPALFAGISLEKLHLGAKSMSKKIKEEKENSDLVKMSQLILELNKKNITHTVLMPYSSKLKSLSDWFVQLWGESLGKLNSKGLNSGLTPIPAYGATDQHSQMQLFMEGPNDKFIIFLELCNRETNFRLSSDLNMPSAVKLKDFDLNQLISAQLKGTMQALEDRARNFANLQISHNNEENMGALILFLECLTVIVGKGLNVDPFDQPGVELGKKYAFQYLNSISEKPIS